MNSKKLISKTDLFCSNFRDKTTHIFTAMMLTPNFTDNAGCWLKHSHMQSTICVFFLFLFMAISVIAGPHYLEGPIKKGHTVLHLRCRKRGETRLILIVKCFHTHHTTKKDPRWCISCCNAPLEMRICQKTSAGVDGLPTPILANKSLAASATFGHKL